MLLNNHTLSRALRGLLMVGLCHVAAASPAKVEHAVLISVDGMHASDLDQFIARHPQSTLATLAAHGRIYSQLRTVYPSDSFPGLLAMITGGQPKSTGIWYDVSYDRRLAPAGSDCKQHGSVLRFDETLDQRDPAGQLVIRESALARDPEQACQAVYPHAALRVNSLFDVIHQAGGATAWQDKHPAYEIVQGPSGHAVDDLQLPEIGANFEGPHDHGIDKITASIAKTAAYDRLKMQTLIAQIKAQLQRPRHGAPSIAGMNMQVLNVAQKRAGYLADGRLSPGLDQAMLDLDGQLHQLLVALREQGIASSTLLIISAKHGNSPILPSRLQHIDVARLRQAIEAATPGNLAQLTADDGALIWLHDPRQKAALIAALRARHDLGIADIEAPAAAATSARTPDLLLHTQAGVIYGAPGEDKKAEHGGDSEDDRHVALLVALPGQDLPPPRRQRSPALSTSIAPSILSAFGLSPASLQAVQQEQTPLLPAWPWPSPASTAAASER